MRGLSGGSMVMLVGGKNEGVRLKGRAGQRLPVIESMPSQVERLLEGAPALIESVSIVVQQVQDLLRPGNRQAVADVMQNLQIFSGMLAAQSPNIARTIEDASATLAELRESSQAMGRLAIRLEKDLVQTISTVNSTAKSIDGAVTDIGVDAQKVLVELRRATESAIGQIGRAHVC